MAAIITPGRSPAAHPVCGGSPLSGDDYLRTVLARHAVATGPGSAAHDAGAELYPWIANWAGAHLAEVSYSGSYAKGTGVSGTTDVDLFISLKANTPGTLKEVYCKLFQAAGAASLSPRAQNVSVGVTHRGVSVDLVPGRIQSGYQNYHSLYRRKADSWTQTNVALHIDTVARSGRTEEIRAIKVWRKLNRLDFPSFYLEMTVIRALKGCRVGNVAANTWEVFRYLAEDFASAGVVDPANTNNCLSDDLTAAEKNKIRALALHARSQGNWENILW